jgi:DNA-binding transcriptional regulator YhcF (GntR family)
MARKKASRNLPPLPRLNVFDVREHKAELVLQTLRHIASAVRRVGPRTFYSMREVAIRFRAPVSTIADVYRRLEGEGILRRIRGSKTTLRGRKHDRKLSVRSFVGLPTTTSKFVTVQDYRMFLKWLCRELRLVGFAVAMLDVERYEPADFAERVRKYEIDTVVWHQPGRLAKQVVPSLNDFGLRVIGVSDGSRPSFPCHYEIQREGAFRKILCSWQNDAGLKSVIIVSGPSPAVLNEQRFVTIAEEEDLKCRICHATSESIPGFLRTLGHKENTGIAFLSSAASVLAFRSPELLTKIFERCRVALIEGPVNMPFAKVPDVRVDLVLVDWQLVAQKIVGDLITDQGFDNARPIIFEAESRLRVPLNQYAEVI